MEYKIEKRIPIPKLIKRRSKSGLSPILRTMEVGDSVLLPQYQKGRELQGGLFQSLRNEGKAFTKRAVEGGVRVRRIQ